MAVKKGQEYEAADFHRSWVRTRIRVTDDRWDPKHRVEVASVQDGYPVRYRRISVTSLHENRNTLMGKPWKTGYVLVKDVRD